jgi:Sec-independent protein translocase protein TatA
MPAVEPLVLAFLNLSPVEIVIILVVAIVVFGRRLPEVAGQAAGAVQRMRRSLEDLRRETGIDREIREARRAVEDAVPRDVRPGAISRKAREGLDKALRSAEVGPGDLPPIPPAKRDPQAPPPPDASARPEGGEPAGGGAETGAAAEDADAPAQPSAPSAPEDDPPVERLEGRPPA